MSQAVLVNYFPAVFCLIRDFPHLLLVALTLLVPTSNHELCCCRPLQQRPRSSVAVGERAARWGWEGWSPASAMGNGAACPACVPGAPRI